MPLFLPIAYTVAAKVEGLTIPEFLQNPTKQTIGLTALYDALGADGIVCFVAAGAEVEALGAELDWESYPPHVSKVPSQPISDEIAALLGNHSRIQTGVDVLSRLATTAREEPLFAVVITGPATLASQLADEPCSSGVWEQCGRVASETARIFGEAGAHVIMIAEETPPPVERDEDYQKWQTALVPAANVAQFYHALAVLVPVRVTDTLAQRFSSGVPGNLLFCVGNNQLMQCIQPAGCLVAGPPAEWQPPSFPVSLLTTAGEIPFSCEISELRDASIRIRADLVTAEI